MSEQEKEKVMIEKLGERATDEFVKWLRKTGFFTAPAALKHHGAHKGGLFKHSFQVAVELNYLTEQLGLIWDRPESPWVVGVLHDICKTDDYIEVGEEDGETIYEYNKDKIIAGHGDKSVLMLAGHFPLTAEEAMCIRFHMGAFVDREEWKYYTRAVAVNPNVLYTHTADMSVSQIIGM